MDPHYNTNGDTHTKGKGSTVKGGSRLGGDGKETLLGLGVEKVVEVPEELLNDRGIGEGGGVGSL
jgi:hypothetical protein